MPRRPWQDRNKQSRRLRLMLKPDEWAWLERASGPDWSGLELNHYLEALISRHVSEHLPAQYPTSPIGPSQLSRPSKEAAGQ